MLRVWGRGPGLLPPSSIGAMTACSEGMPYVSKFYVLWQHLYVVLAHAVWIIVTSGDMKYSSVGRESDWKARRNTDTGSSLWWSKRFFSQSQVPVKTTLRCPAQPQCATACINDICAHVKNPKHWQPYLCWDRKILHTPKEVGSAILAAAAPYPGKATRILADLILSIVKACVRKIPSTQTHFSYRVLRW